MANWATPTEFIDIQWIKDTAKGNKEKWNSSRDSRGMKELNYKVTMERLGAIGRVWGSAGRYGSRYLDNNGIAPPPRLWVELSCWCLSPYTTNYRSLCVDIIHHRFEVIEAVAALENVNSFLAWVFSLWWEVSGRQIVVQLSQDFVTKWWGLQIAWRKGTPSI